MVCFPSAPARSIGVLSKRGIELLLIDSPALAP